MIYLKSDEEIELLRNSNLIVAKTLAELAKIIAPGVSTLRLNNRADEFIRDNGGIPNFLGYGGFPGSICTSVNDQIFVYPRHYKLDNKEKYKNFHYHQFLTLLF